MLPTLPLARAQNATAGALGALQHAPDLVVIGGQQHTLVDRHVRRGRVRPRLGAMDRHGVDRPCRRLLERREGRGVGRPEHYFASGRADGEHRHLLDEDDGQDRAGVRLQARARECGFAIASVCSPVCLFAWPWVGSPAVSTRCVRVACRGAHPSHICPRTRLGPATSAPGLGSPLTHLHRDWPQPLQHLHGTGLGPATSAPGLGHLPFVPHRHRCRRLQRQLGHVDHLLPLVCANGRGCNRHSGATKPCTTSARVGVC
jgi:hypothetical protein